MQRVVYTGRSYPTLANGAEGFVSQLQISRRPPEGWVLCEFPSCTPREHQVPERDLEAAPNAKRVGVGLCIVE